MITQTEHAHLLTKLHIKGNPLILFNIWDAGSACVIQELGAKVIATSNWSVAASHGYVDGEKLPFDFVLANLKRIIACTNLPVTFDFESGYGQSPIEIQVTVKKIIETGAAGINFEDQIIGEDKLHSIEDQCTRIRAIYETIVFFLMFYARIFQWRVQLLAENVFQYLQLNPMSVLAPK